MKTVKIKYNGKVLEIDKELSKPKPFKIPKGKRLLTFEEFVHIWFSHRDKFVFSEDNKKYDEWCLNPYPSKYKYANVWGRVPNVVGVFYDGRLDVGGYVPYFDGRCSFGVRFLEEK